MLVQRDDQKPRSGNLPLALMSHWVPDAGSVTLSVFEGALNKQRTGYSDTDAPGAPADGTIGMVVSRLDCLAWCKLKKRKTSQLQPKWIIYNKVAASFDT